MQSEMDVVINDKSQDGVATDIRLRYGGTALGLLKVEASHTRYRELGPELIPVYRQSARR